jgi:hypothetical protein
MVRRTSVFLMVLVVCSLVCLCAADISGKWKAEFESQVGAQKYTFEFKVEGGKITGSATVNIAGTDMKSKITDGKVEGEKISFSESLDYNGSPLAIEYKGTVSGDEIKVARDVGGQSDGTITLKRVK